MTKKAGDPNFNYQKMDTDALIGLCKKGGLTDDVNAIIEAELRSRKVSLDGLIPKGQDDYQTIKDDARVSGEIFTSKDPINKIELFKFVYLLVRSGVFAIILVAIAVFGITLLLEDNMRISNKGYFQISGLVIMLIIYSGFMSVGGYLHAIYKSSGFAEAAKGVVAGFVIGSIYAPVSLLWLRPIVIEKLNLNLPPIDMSLILIMLLGGGFALICMNVGFYEAGRKS